MLWRVSEKKLFHGGQRHIDPFERIANTAGKKPVFNGVEPLRAFRMTAPHLVLPEIPVCEVASFAHGQWQVGTKG
jgi:hypothetical protein